MIVVGQRLPALIATKPVDFRCGHQALALMMQSELKLAPTANPVRFRWTSYRGARQGVLACL
ncbi:transposase [Rhodobacter capsulatus B6]|nr:transposase [Rhodobacter capsulatus B6]